MTDRDKLPFEAAEVPDELREQLWELAYGLLDEKAAEALYDRVTSDPQVARAYAEVQLEVEQVAACAKLQSAPIELAPSPSAPRRKAAVGQRTQQWSTVLAALAASLLLVLTAYPLIRSRPDPASMARRVAQLTASGPSQVMEGRTAVYRVQARSPEDKRLLSEVPVHWSLVRSEEQQQEQPRGSSVTNVRGEARIELTPAQLERGGTLRLVAGDESPPVELDVQVVPETYASVLSVDSEQVLPGDDLSASLLAVSETRLQKLDDVQLQFGLELESDNGPQDVAENKLAESRDGQARAQLTVSPDARPGRYRLRARNDRYDILEAERVLEVRSPSETEEAGAERDLQGTLEFYSYAAQDKIVADYAAQRADGTPLQLAKVSAEAKDGEGRRAFQMFGRTDSNGAFQVHLPPRQQAPLETLSVRVQDEASTLVTEKEIPEPPALRVQWYPEGGTLAAALPGRVYFRVADQAGQPQAVSGVLLDEQGGEVKQLSSDKLGRGQFRFTPRAGEVYRASLVAESGLPALVTLSADSNQTLSLDCGGGVFAADEPIEVKLLASRQQQLLLVARCRGAIVAEQRLSLQPYDEVDVSLTTESWAPWACGTVRLSAYAVAEPQTPLAERLVYCQPSERREIEASDGDVAVKDTTGKQLSDLAMFFQGPGMGLAAGKFLFGREVAAADRDQAASLLAELPKSAAQLDLLLATQELVEQPHMELLARADNRGQAEEAYRALWAAAAEADQQVLRGAGLVGLAAAVAVLLVLGLTAILKMASWRVWAPALAVASLSALISVAWMQQPQRGPPALAQAPVDAEREEGEQKAAEGDVATAPLREKAGQGSEAAAEAAAKKSEISEGDKSAVQAAGQSGRPAVNKFAGSMGDKRNDDQRVGGSTPSIQAPEEARSMPEAARPLPQPFGPARSSPAPADDQLAPGVADKPAAAAAEMRAESAAPRANPGSADEPVPDAAENVVDAAFIALGEPLPGDLSLASPVNQRGRQMAPSVDAAPAGEGDSLRGGAEGRAIRNQADSRRRMKLDSGAPSPAGRGARDAGGFGGGTGGRAARRPQPPQAAGARAEGDSSDAYSKTRFGYKLPEQPQPGGNRQPPRESQPAVSFNELELTQGDELGEVELSAADLADAQLLDQIQLPSTEWQARAYNRHTLGRAAAPPRVVPAGFPQADARAGVLSQGVTAWHEPPAQPDQTPGSLRAALVLYPSVQSQLRAGVEALDEAPQLSVQAVSSVAELQALALADMQQNRLPDPFYVRFAKERMDRVTRQLASVPVADKANSPSSGLAGQLGQIADYDQRRLLGTTASGAHYSWGGYFWSAPSTESDSDLLYERLGGERSDNMAFEPSSFERLAELKRARASRFNNADGAQASVDASDTSGAPQAAAGGEAPQLSTLDAKSTFDTLAWLHSQRRADGSFGSARATVQALQQIASVAPRPPRQDQQVRVRVDGEEVDFATFETGQAEAVVLDGLEKHVKAESRVEVESTSSYAVPFVFSRRYNLESRPEPLSPLRVSVQADLEVAQQTEVEVHVEVRNNGPETARHVIAHIGLPTGLRVDAERLSALQKSGAFDAFEVQGREVRLAWTEVAAGDDGARSLTLPAMAVLPGSFTGPPSRVYVEASPERTSWAEPLKVQVTIPAPAAR